MIGPVTVGAWTSPGALSGEGPGASWRLALLLEVRARAEAQRRDELGRALAALRQAEGEAESHRAALAHWEGLAVPRAVAPGVELVTAGRFLDRLRRETIEATERARSARAAAALARERHLRARRAREILERGRERWLEERRRAREGRVERELDDLSARGRRS